MTIFERLRLKLDSADTRALPRQIRAVTFDCVEGWHLPKEVLGCVEDSGRYLIRNQVLTIHSRDELVVYDESAYFESTLAESHVEFRSLLSDRL